jgi:hypothetical protein
VAEGNAGAQSLASTAATIAPRHVGGRPGFIDKDQLVGIEIELPLKSFLSTFQDVGTILLRRVAGLFLRVIPWRLRSATASRC